ncbi:hypothetical protein AAG570_011715 [Ranatra chinensis]|uniref:Uncharacterized protein n=1 Tax=Ranatra chinensis TaxID=642074 RepID=A0ABD0YT58_9HEMI
MNALLLLSALVAAVSAASLGPTQHIINEDIDDFLMSVNEAVQIVGLNYLPVDRLPVTMSDSSFESIKLGDMSTWKRVSDAVITGTGLRSFSVSTDIGLGALHFRVDKFVSGSHTGPLTMMVLDNSVHLEFQVQDRFQSSCKVTIDSFQLKSFADPRYYTDDYLASGFMLEKNYILDQFHNTFLSESIQAGAKLGAQNVLQAFLCRNSGATLVDTIRHTFNPPPMPVTDTTAAPKVTESNTTPVTKVA